MKPVFLPLIIAALAATSCFSIRVQSNHSKNEVSAPAPEIVTSPAASVPVSMIPKAKVYKMYGNASLANVPIQISDGKIVSYPAPGDVCGQEPLQMANGYLLDRRGISSDSKFLKWTYSEYCTMPKAPSLEELKVALIPDAGVAEIRVLDMTLSEALADTAAVNAAIRKF